MFISYKIIKKVIETDSVVSLYLSPVNGTLEEFIPGQHITVEIPQGDLTIRRNYTLSDSHGKSHYRITVKKETAGKASNYLHNLTAGQYLSASQKPTGELTLPADKEQPVVLLSAGVGITPMLSILNHMIDCQDKRKVWFIHGAQDERSIIMSDWLTSLSGRELNLGMKIFLSRTNTDHLDEPFSKGRITFDFIKENLKPHYSFLICGPDKFIQNFTADLITWGVAEKNISSEFFSSRRFDEKSRADISGEKEVAFQKSKIRFLWKDQYESLLQFAESKGIAIPFSCRAGTCLTCETKILSGSIRYTSELFYIPEQGSILPCCAIPESDIILDI